MDYEILHVGERSPKDKKYETSEVVFAPPGTVVAPIPKGMKVNMTNAKKLIGEQVYREMQKKPRKMAFGGAVGAPGLNTLGQPIATPGANMPRGGGGDPGYRPGETRTTSRPSSTTISSPGASTYSPAVSTPSYSFGGPQMTSTPVDYGGLLNSALGLGTQSANYGLGQQQIGLGYAGLANEQDLLAQRLASEQALAQMQIEASMQEVMKQIAAQKYIAELQNALGLKALDLQERERLDAWRLGNRNLDIEAMDDEFNRIMRGVAEASVAGVRSGRTPTQGLL